MSLLPNEALKAAKSPPNSTQVKKGEKYQSRLRILTEAYDVEEIQHQSAWQEIKNYLSNTLTSDKYNAIIKYFTFPLSIVNISNDIMTDVYNVFDSRNAAFDIQFQNERFKEIAEQVLSSLNIRNWIEEKGKKVLKSAPNSITIIDLDESGNPLLILLPNEKLLGYEFNKDGSFKYIVFVHSMGKDEQGTWRRIGVYDDEYYRVYFERSGSYTLETESVHGLGYCPAKFFYDKPLLSKHHFDRSVPLTNTMGVMSQWQFFDVFIYYAEHYGTFPITEFAETGCANDLCDNGVITEPADYDGEVLIREQRSYECPSCAKKHLIGPGTAVGIEVSEDPDVQDTRGLLRFVTPDTSSLEYLQNVQQQKENFIKVNTVGFNNAMTKEAVNEQQVRALVESRRKPLLEIKEHLNDLYKWIVKTTIKLLYDVEIVVNADYGTEFFILTEKDIMLLIQEAKKAGVQSSEIEELNKMLIETKYKNNPFKVKKMLIAADVEPSPFDTREEIEKKAAAGMITREDQYIKLNFNDLIGRFERENGSIVFFGMDLPYDVKVQRIYDTLLFYTNQKLESNGNDNSEQSGTGAQGASDN